MGLGVLELVFLCVPVFAVSIFKAPFLEVFARSEPHAFSVLYFLSFTVFLVSLLFLRRYTWAYFLAAVCWVVMVALLISALLTHLLSLDGGNRTFVGGVTDQLYFLLIVCIAWLLLFREHRIVSLTSPARSAFLATLGGALIAYTVISTSVALDRKLFEKDSQLMLASMRREIIAELDDVVRLLGLLRSGVAVSEIPYAADGNLFTGLGVDFAVLEDRLNVVEGLYIYSYGSAGGQWIGDEARIEELQRAFPSYERLLAEQAEDQEAVRIHIASTESGLAGLIAYPLELDGMGQESRTHMFLAKISFAAYLHKLAFSNLQNERMLITLNGYQIREAFKLSEKQYQQWGHELSFQKYGLNFILRIIPDPSLFVQLQVVKHRLLWLAASLAVLMTGWIVHKNARYRLLVDETLELNAQLQAEVRVRREAEAKLKSANRELERSNRDLQEFAQVSSHDLQEPLRIIKAFSERIYTGYRDTLDEKGGDYLNRMLRAVDRMSTLIEELLNYARVETRAQTYKEVDLNLLLVDLQDTFVERLELTQGRIEIEGGMPPVVADETQMRQLFQNLISNGLKFMQPNVPPVVQIRAECVDSKLRIYIRDHGIGMDPKYQHKIFKVFQRLNGRSEYPGTGIGLAICKRIVERHGSELHVDSDLGKGSTFSFYLPVSRNFICPNGN